MTFVDELLRLEELRTRGVLTEDEFVQAKARVLAGSAAGGPAFGPPPPAFSAFARLRRSRSDRWLGGVCGGIAQLTGMDAWICRLLVTVLALFGGAGVLIYLLLWVFVPVE